MAASAPLGARYDPDGIHHDCGWVEHRVRVGLHPIHWLLGEGAMIVCSCNVFSDQQVRSVVAKEARRPRMSEVYAGLGCSAQCGRCAHTIKRIMDEGDAHAC